MKTYSIFGAGASGLYTAWRLLNGVAKNEAGKAKKLKKGDVLELYDWGKYDFSKDNPGTREAGARICTWHYKNDKNQSYLELGGMRYSFWNGDNGPEAGGHRVVTTVINKLGLDKFSVPFNESTNPLYYLRTKNMYLQDITSSNPAPYNVDNYGATDSPDTGFGIIQDLGLTPEQAAKFTRQDWCKFYNDGKIIVDLPEGSVYNKGDLLKDIGYWNLLYDQLGSEGYQYTADGNGYSSNVINWNAALAINSNNEFVPGTEYKTLTLGFSSQFEALFREIARLAKEQGVSFEYHPNTRLHSILQIKGKIHYSIATRANPNKKSASKTTDAAWLAMPRYAVDLVAQATRYETHEGVDVLNHSKVQLYLESAIMQPSYKVGMFFDSEWWMDKANTPYPPQLTSYEITNDVLKQMTDFPKEYIQKISANSNLIETPFATATDFINTIQSTVNERLTYKQEQQVLAVAERNTIGPSVTDTPIRQVVYFGNNALDKKSKPVYGLLASYDDEQFTTFWQELEIGPDRTRKVPISENTQPLEGPRKAPDVMVKMLRKQLAAVHFGPAADYTAVPEPIETSYMDWSLPPFNAGYHAFAAHYDIGDVQQKIRKPSQLIEGTDANIFIVGETYSNDQAWVEGAYCTSESVLNDFFDIVPIIDNTFYPFICPKADE
jgi:hypothetical protein